MISYAFMDAQTGSYAQLSSASVLGMNWKMPRAPEGFLARGLPPLSAKTISSAVTSRSPLKPTSESIFASSPSEPPPMEGVAASVGVARPSSSSKAMAVAVATTALRAETPDLSK